MITKIHLFRVIKPGGVENMSLNLTKLDRKNDNIAIYTKNDVDIKFLKILENFFKKIIYVDQNQINRILIKLIKDEKRNNKNVILVSWYFPFSIKIIRGLNIPILNHIGTSTYAYNFFRVLKNQIILLNLFIYKKNKISFIYASNHIKVSFKKKYFFPKYIIEKMIYNGDENISDIKFKNKNNSFGMIGRLEKTKNFIGFINFAKRYDSLNKSNKYYIIGSGPDHYKLKKYNEENNSICEFLGNFYDKNELYKNLDILIFFNTISEGFGNVVIESMNRGKLVAVQDCGGPSELIEDGYDGIKFKNIDDLIDKLDYTLRNKKLFNRILFNAKKSFKEKFDIKKIKSEYDHVLGSMLT